MMMLQCLDKATINSKNDSMVCSCSVVTTVHILNWNVSSISSYYFIASLKLISKMTNTRFSEAVYFISLHYYKPLHPITPPSWRWPIAWPTFVTRSLFVQLYAPPGGGGGFIDSFRKRGELLSFVGTALGHCLRWPPQYVFPALHIRSYK